MRSAIFPAILAVALALAIPGCSVEHRVTGPLPWATQPPTPNSPQTAIRLFEWGWDHRDLGAFENLLTADFRFVFALADSAGNQFRDHPFGREEMLGCLRHVFVGGGMASPATSISLTLDPELRALPDSRAGKNGTWHKEILTSVDLTIMTEGGTEYRIVGDARFFVVRGDSAIIPADLVAEGGRPDSARWYLEQWNDETMKDATALAAGAVGPGDLLAPQPSGTFTWGDILALYYWGPRAARP
jgi:hypothetical protein